MSTTSTIARHSIPFDPEHTFVTSWCLSPLLLAAVRFVFAFYCWVNIFYTFGYEAVHNPASAGQSFSFFTDLTWWGIAFYTAISSVYTIIYWKTGRNVLDQFPRPLQLAHTAFYSTIVIYPFLVTVVFWSILYGGRWFKVEFDAYSNVSRHALNSLIALCEIILPATFMPPAYNVIIVIVILAMYLGLAYITRATEGFYPYDFLDPAYGKGRLVGFIIGIAVATVILFFIVAFLIWARRKLAGTGKKSVKDRAVTQQFVRQEIELVGK